MPSGLDWCAEKVTVVLDGIAGYVRFFNPFVTAVEYSCCSTLVFSCC